MAKLYTSCWSGHSGTTQTRDDVLSASASNFNSNPNSNCCRCVTVLLTAQLARTRPPRCALAGGVAGAGCAAGAGAATPAYTPACSAQVGSTIQY